MTLKNFWDVTLLAGMWVAAIVAFGLIARVGVWLFCLGYGC